MFREVVKRIMAVTLVMFAVILLILCSAYNGAEKDFREAETSVIKSRDWGGDDSNVLAQVAMYLAENDDMETKMLSILVCLNKTWEDGFPDSIEENAGAMTSGGYKDMDPNEDCYEAVARVQFEGWNKSQNAVFMSDKSNDIQCDILKDIGFEKVLEHGRYAYFK